ncbi:MAG: Cell shape-determining protein MreC precursor [Verrucomicrobiota bacterium]|jgi:rod shape-determining protein MreC
MRFRSKLIAAALFVVAVGVLILGAGNQAAVRGAQSSFLSLITPFLKSGSALERKFTAFREGLKTLEDLESECRTLRTVNKELSATNQVLRGLESENNRLRNALGYRERSIFKLLPARIIGRDISTWFNQVTIDRGSEDGLRRDMPVLTEDGLVGKTTAVSEHSAVVVLISDESCKVAAVVENSREQGIARGERASSATTPMTSLFFLSKQAGLKPGQRVLTSGVGGVFPAGVLLGAVQEFRVRELDGFASLVPAVDLTTLQDVFVVVSQQK